MHNNKIKILYLGAFGKHCSDSYRVDGLKNCGLYDVVDVIDFRRFKKFHPDNFAEMIGLVINNNQPDVLLMNKAESITYDDVLYWKKNYPKLVIAYWYGDMRDGVADYVKDKLQLVDAFLTNADDDKYYKEISSYGIDKNKIFYSHTATDTDVFNKNENIDEEYDIIFFGSNYNNLFTDSNIRLEYIKKLNAEDKYKIKIFGGNWYGLGDSQSPVYGEEFASQASKAKIILGFSSFTSVNKYTSNRIWNSMACGFYLCHEFAGIGEIFEKGKHLEWFNDYDEMKFLIDYYLKNENKRKIIFQTGRQQVLRYHTYSYRAIEMYSIFKKLIKRK